MEPYSLQSVFWSIGQLTTHLADSLQPFPHEPAIYSLQSVFWTINQLTTHLADALYPFPHGFPGDLVQKGGESMQQVAVCEHKG
jgi:hypothetical protein